MAEEELLPVLGSKGQGWEGGAAGTWIKEHFLRRLP